MPRERFPTHSVPVSQTLKEQLFPPSTMRLDCLILLEDASLILTDYFRKWPEFSNILADRSDGIAFLLGILTRKELSQRNTNCR
jgi:hypothetical protein